MSKKRIFLIFSILISALILSASVYAATLDFTAEAIPSGDGISFVRQSKYLYLNDAIINDDIVLPENSTIELHGSNTVNGTIKSNGKITIRGSGSLMISANSQAIKCAELSYKGFNAYSDEAMKNKISVSDQNKIVFVPVQYNLNVTFEGEGSVTPSQGKFAEGEEIEILAESGEDYRFDSWTCSSGKAKFTFEGNTAKLIMPDEDVTVHAKFVEGKEKYTVTVEIVEPYSCTTSVSSAKYSQNDLVKIESTARSGYAIAGWSSSDINIGDPLSPTLKFIMPAKAVTVSIYYKPITYRFKVESDENGTVEIPDKDPDEFGYYYFNVNEEINIVATPEKNFFFGGWSASEGADIYDISSKTTVLKCPPSDFVLKAQFASALRELTVTHEEGGNTIPSDVKVQYGVGCILDLSAVPDDGYVFSEWKCSSEKGEFKDKNAAKTTFTMPDDNCTVTAVFKKGGYTLKLIAKSGGQVSPQISSHEMGEVVSIKASPHAGYRFVKWECEDESLVTDPGEAETTMIMPANNVKISAVFELTTSFEDNDAPDTQKTVFKYLPIVICFILAIAVIIMIIIREKYKLSYRYMFKKLMNKLFGDD